MAAVERTAETAMAVKVTMRFITSYPKFSLELGFRYITDIEIHLIDVLSAGAFLAK